MECQSLSGNVRHSASGQRPGGIRRHPHGGTTQHRGVHTWRRPDTGHWSPL